MGLFNRHLRLLFVVTALVVAAFSTGIDELFFIVYLTVAIGIGSWVYARRGLTGVRADYRVINPRTHVGELLQAIYRVENHDRLGKPWIECWNESTMPNSLPGRVVGLPSRGTRQWLAKVTLTRRGSFRLGPLRVRTGDPFGLFSTEMQVGQPTSVVVFPEIVALPHWRLPPSPIDGTAPARRRFEAATPLVSTVRPYVHGDAINRIHWLSSARHSELLVKEFDLEQAADLWMLLDLDRGVHAGIGNDRIGPAHPGPPARPRTARRAEAAPPAGQRPGRWRPLAGRSAQRHRAAASARHDALHHHRLDRSHLGARPLGPPPSRRRGARHPPRPRVVHRRRSGRPVPRGAGGRPPRVG
jgi:hypothetical protein